MQERVAACKRRPDQRSEVNPQRFPLSWSMRVLAEHPQLSRNFTSSPSFDGSPCFPQPDGAARAAYLYNRHRRLNLSQFFSYRPFNALRTREASLQPHHASLRSAQHHCLFPRALLSRSFRHLQREEARAHTQCRPCRSRDRSANSPWTYPPT